MVPNRSARVVTRAAPVGVTVSPSTSTERTGTPFNIAATAGAGNGVDRADLVEVHLLGGLAVDLSFRLSQSPKDAPSQIDGTVRHTGGTEDLFDIREIAVTGVLRPFETNLEAPRSKTSRPRRRPVEGHIGKSELPRQLVDERALATRLGQGTQHHVAGRSSSTVEE